MVKHENHPGLLFSLALLAFLTGPWAVRPALALGPNEYNEEYTPSNRSPASCTIQKGNDAEAKQLVKSSIDVNLEKFRDNIVNRLDTITENVSKAVAMASATGTNDSKWGSSEIIKAMEADLTERQRLQVDDDTLRNQQAMKSTEVEEAMTTGLSMYRPELVTGARQSEMKRYISELNNVPLDNRFRTSTGQSLPGYVDTSLGDIAAQGQEFRNYVRFFCDARSLNGKLASTKFLEYNGPMKSVSEYWCGQGRGLPAPAVTMKDGRYQPLEGDALMNHVNAVTKLEAQAAVKGEGKAYLVNLAKDPGKLYLDSASLEKKSDIYEKAEQQFARFVVGRAPDLKNLSDFSTGEGQRAYMDLSARTARLALARYVYADMFSRKVPTMPEGSSSWAADMIEKNIGDCKNPPTAAQCRNPTEELAPKCGYAPLCKITAQLRSKGQISVSEFMDVLYGRQFQGMAFTQATVGMSEGQLKRVQTNLLSLQLALNYQRNRLKEQQLALMAAIYAQQNH